MIKVIIFDFDGLVFDTESYDLESFKILYSRYDVSFPLDEWLVSIGSKLHYNPYEKLLNERPTLMLDDLRKERMALYKASFISNHLEKALMNTYNQRESTNFLLLWHPVRQKIGFCFI